MKNTFPIKIPIFPLNGVIYFPKTNLPLNIFEPRYLDLINDSMKKDKLIGMVQSKSDGSEVYNVGCLGKINELQKTKDGRMLVNLTGLTRFEIVKEIENEKQYREFEVKYQKFDLDLNENTKNLIEDEKLFIFMDKTKKFFKKNGLLLNWKEFQKLNQNQQINTLAMIAPVSNEEKQKLLETVTMSEKTETLLNIIEFYLHESSSDKTTIQ
jgi:uncharacterized protein